MFGRRTPQTSLFDVASLPHRVAPDSFYGRMGAVAETLFQDDELKQLYAADTGRPSLPPSLMAGYVDQDRKAAIDWADPTARAEQLQVLAADAEAALDAILPDCDDAEVRTLSWLLTKILGDDLVTDAQGQVQLGEGTAPERIISITDPEMHHGRKSAARRFAGFKAVFVTEQSSELLLDVADAPAPGSDGRQLIPALQRAEAAAEVTVAQVLADGACGSGDIRATCADQLGHALDLVVPVAQPADPAVAKTAFQIDLAAQTATCPQGQTVAGQPCKADAGRAILSFTFARATCEACPLFTRCVRSKTLGRTGRTNAHEELLQAARRRQQTAEFKALYPHSARPSSAKGPNWFATACAIPATWATASGSCSDSGSAPPST